MIKMSSLFLIACILLLIQAMVKTLFPEVQVVPDMALICVMYFGVYQTGVAGLLSSFVLGYLADATSGAPDGLMASSYCMVFILVRLLGRTFYMRSRWFQIILVGVMTSFWRGSCYALLTWFPGGMEYAALVFSDFIYRILVNILFAPIIFSILFRIDELTTKDYQSRMVTYRIH